MPNPLGKDYFDADALLTDFTTAEIQGAEGFVHSMAAPTLGVRQYSGTIKRYDRSFFNRSLMQPRPRATAAAGGEFDFLTDLPYNTYPPQALKMPVDWDEIDNATIGDPLQDAAEYLGQQGLLKREEDFVTAAFSTGKWTTDVDVSGLSTGKWNTTTGDPIGDIKTSGISVVIGFAGFRFRPNRLIIDYPTWLAITENPNVISRLSDSEARITDEEKFANLVGVKEVLIAGGIKTTSKPGATITTSGIAGNGALLLYAAERVGLMTPTGMVKVVWTAGRGLSSEGVRTRRYTDENIKSEVPEAETFHQFLVTAPDLGVFFHTTI